MPSEDFLSVSSFETIAPGVTEGRVPASWMQGRSAYGGLSAAIALRPMSALVTPERRLRTLQVTFVGPLSGELARCETRLLRAGKALSVVESRITQSGETRCVALGSFAEDRASSLQLSVPDAAPRAPGGITPGFMPGLMPEFLRHFETRWDNQVFPGSGSKDGHALTAVRFARESRDVDVCDLVGLLDAFPPSPSMMLAKTGFTASSVSWTLDVLIDLDTLSPKLRTDEHFLYEVRTLAVTGGYGQTEAWLYAPSGQALLRSTQLVAIFESDLRK